ncbi:MAG: hypothetical protein ACREJD_02175 [Phycisphaerales bacterium]
MMKSTVLVCVASVGLAAALLAGPLTPPAGPIASTYKTLAEVEPRKVINSDNTPGDANAMAIISSPGSYMLAGDLICTGGKSGIRVETDNVTIDLQGFSIDGKAGTNTFGSGVLTSTSRRNIAIRNGSVHNFGAYGITGSMPQSQFENLSINDNKLGQLEPFNASNSIARNLRIHATSGEMNLSLGKNAIVEDCTVEGGFSGIFVGSGVVARCTVSDVAGIGIRSGGGVVTQCSVSDITGTSSFNNGGIVVDGGTLVERCTMSNCTATGVYLGSDCRLVDSTFRGCAKGVFSSQFQGGHSTIERNTFTSCTIAVKLETPGHIIVSNRFSQNTTNINAVAGSTLGEELNMVGGGTLTAANSHALANVVY